MNGSQSSNVEHPLKRARLYVTDISHSPIVGVLDEDADDADSEFYGEVPESISNHASLPDQSGQIDTLTTLLGHASKDHNEIPGLFLASSMANSSKHVQGNTENGLAGDENNELVPINPSLDTTKIVPVCGTSLAVALSSPHGIGAGQFPCMPHKDLVLATNLSLHNASPGGDEIDSHTNLIGAAVSSPKKDEALRRLISTNLSQKPLREHLEPEFLALAEANKSNKAAEWRFDSSDGESSAEGFVYDNSEDDDVQYVTMKPDEIATLLLREIDDDVDKSGPGPIRTKNEVVEEDIKVEKPEIMVSNDMRIEFLGTVDSIVDNMLLIRASLSGDYQVLSEGSILVLEDRSVVGSVADTLGRVEEPLYTVRFNNHTEISDSKIELGQKIFYLPSHATYVFTQALLAQKGSDASNIHDEEPAEADVEFSDDEMEAEYRRKSKETRRNTDKNRNSKDINKMIKKPFLAKSIDEPYVTLQRPANLHEMLAPLTEESEASRFHSPGSWNISGRRVSKESGRGSRSNDRAPGRNSRKSRRRTDENAIQKHANRMDHISRLPPRNFEELGQSQNRDIMQEHSIQRQFVQSQPENPSLEISNNQQGHSQHLFQSYCQFPAEVLQQAVSSASHIQGMSLPSGSYLNPAFLHSNQESQSRVTQHSRIAVFDGTQPLDQDGRFTKQPHNSPPYIEDPFKALQDTLDILKAQQMPQQK